MSSGHQQAAFRHLMLTSAVAVLAFAMAFVSGYLFGRAESGPRAGPVTALLEPLTRALPTADRSTAGEARADDEQRLKVLREAWGIIERDYYERSALDPQKMVYGATKGMVESLGDPHTVFMTPVVREVSDTELRGTFDGIGIYVDMREGKLTVVSPVEGSPADQAGLKPGDVITHADDQPLAGKSLNDTIMLIRGPRGTTVSLTVTRSGAPEPLTFSITRAEIRLVSVRSRMLDEGVGYLRITAFSSDTSSQATASLQDLLARQPQGLVVDLRSNPGGYLHSAVEVASQFMTDGVVLYQASGNGERQAYRAEPGGLATQARLVVLVNKGTASASEILAAALRDNNRAVLVGEKTFGKGTVQNVHELSDRSGLRVTTAQWLRPSEQPLQGVGVTPDILAPEPPDGPGGPDPQLESAVRYLLGG